DRVDVAIRPAVGTALHDREDVALEHDAAVPAFAKLGGYRIVLVVRARAGGLHAVRRHHSAAAGNASPAIQQSRSASARWVSARFLAMVFAGPRKRSPSGPRVGMRASGGNSPKLTFIGWNEGGPASIVSMCPPVMWPSSAPCAVVGGGSAIGSPSRSAAAKRPASKPIAADST